MTSPLLINESPLQVLPSLALKIGLNEAIVLQQIHYWLSPKFQTPEKHFNGRYWTHNTIAQWMAQFPFWAEKTVRRTINTLKERGLILTHTKKGFQKVIFYTIDYEVLSELHGLSRSSQKTQNRPYPCGQYDQTHGQKILAETLKATIEIDEKHDINSKKPNNTHDFQISRPCGQYDQIDVAKLDTSLTKNTTPENINKNTPFPSLSENLTDSSWDFARRMCVIFSEFVLDKRHLSLHPSRAQALKEAFYGPLNQDMEAWRSVCNNVTRSYFLMGEEKNTKFRASLDWVISENNLIRIMEGSAYAIGARTGYDDARSKALQCETKASQLANKQRARDLEIKETLSLIEDPQWAAVCEHFINKHGIEEYRANLRDAFYRKVENEDFLVCPTEDQVRRFSKSRHMLWSLREGYPDFINIYKIKVITADEAQRNSVLLQASGSNTRKGFGFTPFTKPASIGCTLCSKREACTCLGTNENTSPLLHTQNTTQCERNNSHATQ